jgi:hypothetical protein
MEKSKEKFNSEQQGWGGEVLEVKCPKTASY